MAGASSDRRPGHVLSGHKDSSEREAPAFPRRPKLFSLVLSVFLAASTSVVAESIHDAAGMGDLDAVTQFLARHAKAITLKGATTRRATERTTAERRTRWSPCCSIRRQRHHRRRIAGHALPPHRRSGEAQNRGTRRLTTMPIEAASGPNFLLTVRTPD